MNAETQETSDVTLPQPVESAAGGVSVRAWIAVLLTCTVCCMSAVGMTVEEPLYTLVGMALGWYFGQKENK